MTQGASGIIVRIHRLIFSLTSLLIYSIESVNDCYAHFWYSFALPVCLLGHEVRYETCDSISILAQPIDNPDESDRLLRFCEYWEMIYQDAVRLIQTA